MPAAGRTPRTRRASLADLLPPALRGAALLPAAALGVHQLRYELAFGAHAPQALAEQGHAYLATLAPWIVLLATLALGATLGGLARRWAAGGALGTPRRHPGLRVWALAAGTLIAVYAGQELLEGLLASGHAGGLRGVFGGGGWWAIPAALVLAVPFALALRAGELAECIVGAGARRPLVRALALERVLRPAAAPFLPAPDPLARAAAGRAPPRAAST